MKAYEMKPGEYTSFANIRYRCRYNPIVDPSERCNFCAFSENKDGHNLCHEAICSPRARKDRKAVYFVKVGIVKKRVRNGHIHIELKGGEE